MGAAGGAHGFTRRVVQEPHEQHHGGDRLGPGGGEKRAELSEREEATPEVEDRRVLVAALSPHHGRPRGSSPARMAPRRHRALRIVYAVHRSPSVHACHRLIDRA